MSLVIFFGMAFFIFVLGVVVISVTVYQWNQQKKLKLEQNINKIQREN